MEDYNLHNSWPGLVINSSLINPTAHSISTWMVYQAKSQIYYVKGIINFIY